MPGSANAYNRMSAAHTHAKANMQRGTSNGGSGAMMAGPQSASGKPVGSGAGLGRKGSMPENLMNPLNPMNHPQHAQGSAAYLHG
jgi:hypothetical protein